jgi:predicted ATPase
VSDIPFIKRYAVKGLQYYHDFEINFSDVCCILVGENGLGKTTILNILYAVLAKKWAFLTDCAFDFIEIEFKENRKISFSHSELDAYLIEKYTGEKDNLGIKENITEYFVSIENTITLSLSSQILYLPAFRNVREDLMILRRKLSSATKTSGETNTIDEQFDADFASIEDEILIPFELNYLKSNLLTDDNRTTQFLNTCNLYLVNTRLIFNKTEQIINLYSKEDPNEQISVTQLSSGEKQILYIFSRIYLNYKPNLCILFDEPEMSLSLTWQRKILPDIIKSGKCSFLFAITHSPFIFDNKLDEHAEGINIYFK